MAVCPEDHDTSTHCDMSWFAQNDMIHLHIVILAAGEVCLERMLHLYIVIVAGGGGLQGTNDTSIYCDFSCGRRFGTA